MDSLDTIRQQIKQGDHEGAKRALGAFLCKNPRSVPAWSLLAGLLSEPERQAECFRRILALEPHNKAVATMLQRLTGAPPQANAALRCPQCGGSMEVRFEGELKDKRAICQYCGTEVDLPDTYQRVERHREQEQQPFRSRTVDKTVIETRSDHPGALPDMDKSVKEVMGNWMLDRKARTGERALHIKAEGPEEVHHLSKDDLARWLAEQGVPNVKEALQKIQQLDPGEQLNIRIEQVGDSQEVSIGPKKLYAPRRRSGPQQQLTITQFQSTSGQATSYPTLNPDEIIQAAGGALPPEQRRKCPHCDATISKQATRCEWCGKQLGDEG